MSQITHELLLHSPSSLYDAAKLEEAPTSPHQHVSRPKRQTNRSYVLPTLIAIADTSLTLAPCLFLILALEALYVNETPISQHGQKIEQAAKLGPTVFPIVFAAIVGRLMRTYALWRAERGATIGVLEALNGSQNLLAAAERVVRLPGLGILGFGIILLWMLSPIGGQSSLRVISRASVSITEDSSIFYFNTTGTLTAGAFGDSYEYNFDVVPMNAIFDAIMVSLQKVKGSDLWGNIKIPYIEQVSSFIAENSTDGWYHFSEDDYNATYSALNGVVVSGLDAGFDTDFILASSYFNLTCGDRHAFGYYDPFDHNMSCHSAGAYGGFYEWANLTMHNISANCLFELDGKHGLSGDAYSSYLLDTNYHFIAKPIPTEFNIIYASRSVNISAYNCSLGLTQVESQVHCAGTDCQLQAIRYAPNTYPSHLDWPVASQFVRSFKPLLVWLEGIDPVKQSGLTSAVDWLVSGSDVPFQSETTTIEAEMPNINWDNVSGATVAQRLGALLNTGWQLSFQQQATARAPSNNATALAAGSNLEAGGVGYDTVHVVAPRTAKHDIFVASMVWVVITFAIAFILLLCGVASMVFKYGTHAPDMLGFVSSMTRDNQNFELVPGGDKLDGLQLARKLRDVRVQIADIDPMGRDGYVTLVNIDSTLAQLVQGSKLFIKTLRMTPAGQKPGFPCS